MIHTIRAGPDNYRWPARRPRRPWQRGRQGGSVEDVDVVLRRAPLFDGLDEESARALRRQMPDVKMSRGEHLFNEGDGGDRLYVVLDGKIKLTRTAPDGRENLLSALRPADMFCEPSLFHPH